jgi:hypothetical protein
MAANRDKMSKVHKNVLDVLTRNAKRTGRQKKAPTLLDTL